VKKLVIISLSVIIVTLMALHFLIYDATKNSPVVCNVHGERMSERTVEMRWGMKGPSAEGEARQSGFPYADEPYESGFCLKPRESYARVYVCAKCNSARATWLAANKPQLSK